MSSEKAPLRRLSRFGKLFAVIAVWVFALMFVAIAQDKELWVVLAVAACSVASALVTVGDWFGFFD